MNRENDAPQPALPTTQEEYMRALREAFVRGSDWSADWMAEDAPRGSIAEARRRYPIRWTVPRVVDLSSGIRARVAREGGLHFFTLDAGHEYAARLAALTTDDARALLDLLENPVTVEES